MKWDCWANVVMLWPHGLDMGYGGDVAGLKKAKVGCRGGSDVRGVRCGPN